MTNDRRSLYRSIRNSARARVRNRIIPLLLGVLAMAAAAMPGPGWAATVSPLPFDMPSTETLRQSPKKVFAHYVPWYPISIDNVAADQDYYTTHYLDPAGEGGKYASSGGLLRARPLPQPPLADPEWQLRNAEREVRRAIAVGIDGFTVDIVAASGPLWDAVIRLLQAAANVDPGFKIMLMPDMEGVFKTKPELLRPSIVALSAYPSVFRMDDGRLVISPFNAQNLPASAWANWLTVMRNSGVDIAFVPTLLNWRAYASEFQSISAGFADWGSGSAENSQQYIVRNAPNEAHTWVPIWMAPVRPQVFVPSQFHYRESANSLNYRKTWTTAILGNADWVDILTWNDYAEGTQIAPSTLTQLSYYDLTAYYVTWFKTGQPPPIKRDVLYYFHRPHHTLAAPDWSKQTGGAIRFVQETPTDARRDMVEVVAFLTAPGTVEIKIGSGAAKTFAGVAGQNFFSVPLAEGRPSFRLLRKGPPVLSFQSAFPIVKAIVYQDLLYRGGSSSRAPLP